MRDELTPLRIAEIVKETVLIELKCQTNTYNDVADLIFNQVFGLSSQMLIEMEVLK